MLNYYPLLRDLNKRKYLPIHDFHYQQMGLSF